MTSTESPLKVLGFQWFLTTLAGHNSNVSCHMWASGIVQLQPVSWSLLSLMEFYPSTQQWLQKVPGKFLELFYCTTSYFLELCHTTSSCVPELQSPNFHSARLIYSSWDSSSWTMVWNGLQAENQDNQGLPSFVSLFLGTTYCHDCFLLLKNSCFIYFIQFSRCLG